MKKHEVKTGGTYLAKVSDKVVPVRIDAENPRGGWNATNTVTKKPIRIKSAQRLRGPAANTSDPTAKRAKAVAEAQAKAAAANAHAVNPNAKVPDEAAATKRKPSAATKPKAAKTPKEPKPAKARKPSALDTAFALLAESAQPMTCKELIDTMASRKLWTSPGGKTPSATLNAALAREIKLKGKDSRFKKVERGKFAATSKA